MKRKTILTLTAATFAMIGAGTIFFNTMSETAMAARAGQLETIPTSYQVPDSRVVVSPEPDAKDGQAQKVNYSVSMDSLNTGTPTDMDLTMEEAAETGTQYLREIFGLDLEGAYVSMMYYPGTVTFPRPFWSGEVVFEKEKTLESTRWNFMVDAVTGELFNAGYGRHLDANPSLSPDAALVKDYGIYAELAEKITVEHKLMSSSIGRVDYNCQGYDGNDPMISVNVIGENGEMLTMSFSRYDQAFLGLITDTSIRISDSALDDIIAGGGADVEVDGVEYSLNEAAK